MAMSPDTVLALTYAPPHLRPAIEVLMALDATLANIVRTTREPLIGQMRLTWWYEAVSALDQARPPAEPTLQALYRDVLPHGVTAAALAGIVEGWEPLLEPVLDDAVLARFASERGGRLFAACAHILGSDDPRIDAAGRGWALADLHGRVSDPVAAARVKAMAGPHLDAALTGRWPRRARALGALALTAQFDLCASPPPPGSPKRVGRLAWHRLTGY